MFKIFYFPDKTHLYCHDESLTRQSDKDACDINFIVNNFLKNNVLTHVNPSSPNYGDFSDYGDLRSSLEKLSNVEEFFSNLPSSIRYKFGNDFVNFYEFASDPSNRDELVSMGLVPTSNVENNSVETPSPSEDKKKSDAPS